MGKRSGWVARCSGLLVALVLIQAGSVAMAQYRRGPGRMRPPDDGPRPHRAEHYSILTRPPHRGQIVSVGPCYAEVVFRTWETRVYLYDQTELPLSTAGMPGQVTMLLTGIPQPVVATMEHVPQPKESTDQDYLATVIDVPRLPAPPMQVSFRLGNPPVGNMRELTFGIPFALSPTSAAIVAVPLTAADNEGIARQRFCPVTELELGSRGAPVKLLVGQQVVYLCYRGCIPQFEARPDSYIARLTTAGFGLTPQAAQVPPGPNPGVVR